MKFSRAFFLALDRAIDVVLNFLCLYLSYFVVLMMFPKIDSSNMTLSVLLCTMMSVVTSLLYHHHGVYEPMRTHKLPFYLPRIFIVNTEMFTFSFLTFLILFHENFVGYLIWGTLTFIFSTIVIVAKKSILMTTLGSIRSKNLNIKHIVVVTDSQDMVDSYMEEVRKNPKYGYSVIGYVGNVSIVGLPHLGTTADLDHIIKEYQPDEVVMAFDTVRKKMITRYVTVCNDNCCKVMFVPAICGYFRAPRQVRQIGNLPLIDIRSTPLDNMTNQIVKRAMDIIGSSLLILMTLPVMIAVAIGVKISSPGPILFRQTRVGKNNQEFTMYKFRSMKVNNQQQTGWSNEKDDRKTKFGAFIRKFALDELPQFFNVLFGDMSLVGPRPEVPFYVEKFKKEIPLYMLKHTLRPGITGLAQIKGLRGDTSIQARIEEDINYIENWSVWGDLRILFLTPFKAVNRHEKYVATEAEHQKRTEESENRKYIPRWKIEAENNDHMSKAVMVEEPAPELPNAEPEPLWSKEIDFSELQKSWKMTEETEVSEEKETAQESAAETKQLEE